MITADSAPDRRDGLTSTRLGQEALVIDEPGGLVVPLNPTAAVVWECLDGTANLAEMAADLAEAFGADEHQVLHDVVGICRELELRGLLRGSSTSQAVRGTRRTTATRTTTVRAGATRIRISADDESLLAEVAAGYEVLPDAASETALSISSEPRRGQVPPIATLHDEDGRPLFRTHVRAQLVAVARARIERTPVPANTIRLNASLLVGHRRAIAVGGHGEPIAMLEPLLRRRGWSVVLSDGLDLDRQSCTVLLPPSSPKVVPPNTKLREVVITGGVQVFEQLSSAAQRAAALAPLVTWPMTGVDADDISWLATDPFERVLFQLGDDPDTIVETLRRDAGRKA